MAACDCQELGAVGEGSPSPDDSAVVDAHEPEPRPEPTSPRVGADLPAATPRRRASQTTPPAIRRAVMRRDRQRCVVEGCTNHLFLDVHHVDGRSEGGSHDPDRLACMCGSHHRAVHAGRLCIDGSASKGFTFRHADGTPYGQPLRPAAIELTQQALGALRNLGFPPSRARALVYAVLHGGTPEDLGAFVRAALEAS